MRALDRMMPELGGLSGQPAESLSAKELRTALDARVAAIGAKALPGVSVFFVFVWLLNMVGGDTPFTAPVAFATALAMVTPLAVGLALKSGRIAQKRANAAVALATAVTLLQALLWFVGAPSLTPALHTAALLVGSSAVVLSWRWLALLQLAALGGWGLAASRVLEASASGPAQAIAAAVAGASAVGCLIHRGRLRGYAERLSAELKQAQREEMFERLQSRYESAIRGANEGLWFWDLQADQVYASARWAEMAGYPPEACSMCPQEWLDTVDPYDRADLREAVEAHLRGETAQLEYKHRLRRADGSTLWTLTRGLVARDRRGRPVSIAGSISDISDIIDIEQRLVDDALLDRLTGLPNRHRLMDLLEAACARCTSGGTSIALAFIDLDDFKLVNDNMGHLAGDQLLMHAADRLLGARRPSETLARYGGDEFVILVEDADAAALDRLGERVQSALATPVELDGQMLKMTASVGIASCDAPVSPTALLRDADIAMYEAKAAGKGRCRVFNAQMHRQVQRTWKLHNAVRSAVEKDECSLHYQPVVSAETSRPVGAEALFRWRPRDGQSVETGEFILAAEKTGAILEIGEWALRQACEDAASWQSGGGDSVPVAVNVSVHQAKQPGFSRSVERILCETGLDPYWLDIELTETAMMENSGVLVRNLRELAEMGVGCAIDDFGTGYSSLSYLAGLPLKTLKIDGAFVEKIGVDRKSEALTSGIISMARSLGLGVTAEQVETPEQLEFLRHQHCDRIQGFLACEPADAHTIRCILESGSSLLPENSSYDASFESLAQAQGAGGLAHVH